jgi:hypothetical protein
MSVRSELPEDRGNALDVERLAFLQARNGDGDAARHFVTSTAGGFGSPLRCAVFALPLIEAPR